MLWRPAVGRSRDLVAEAPDNGGLDRLASRPWPESLVPSLRWIVVQMIEKYARHNSQANFLRESVDGQTVTSENRATHIAATTSVADS